MDGEKKSYGYEGGYEDWTPEKVFSNMRIGKQSEPSEPLGIDVVAESDTDDVIDYESVSDKELDYESV